MNQLSSKNKTTLPFSSSGIWNIITDINSYPEWWPTSVKIKVLDLSDNLIGSVIKIKPYGGLGFNCEISEAVENKRLILKYSGIYSGTGIWNIIEGSGMSTVTYEINLKIESLFIRMLSVFLPIDKIHFNLMNDVLSALQNRLKNRTLK